MAQFEILRNSSIFPRYDVIFRKSEDELFTQYMKNLRLEDAEAVVEYQRDNS